MSEKKFVTISKVIDSLEEIKKDLGDIYVAVTLDCTEDEKGNNYWIGTCYFNDAEEHNFPSKGYPPKVFNILQRYEEESEKKREREYLKEENTEKDAWYYNSNYEDYDSPMLPFLHD